MTNKKKGPNEARLNTIMARQDKVAFGADYESAIRATREEAPKISRAFTLFDSLLKRCMHLLSLHELAAALFALYIPTCRDIQEQKMLWVGPHTHPLFGFPGVDATTLPSVAGTLVVAERLGYLSMHPTIRVPGRPDIDGPVPYPLLGDLLLFLEDEQGMYCVNWPVKRREADFWRPTRSVKSRNLDRAIRKATARTEIEIGYYDSASIRSHLVFYQPQFKQVVANLRSLHAFQVRSLKVDDEARADMVIAFKVALLNGDPPSACYMQLAARHRCAWMECQTVLFQAIWRRQLRVDLYQPLLPDYPLEPETRDFLEDIRDWYRR